MIYRISIVLLCLFAGCQFALSQGPESFWTNEIAPYSNWYIPIPGTKETIESRWNEIGEDLKTEKNPLAGTYAERGYESGYFLRWSSNKGFILVPYYDQSMITDFSYGRVEITADSEIILIPEREMEGRGRRLRKTPRTWVPAIDGKFLVPDTEIALFGDYYGGYGQYNGFPRKRGCDGCGTFAERRDIKKGAARSFLAPPKYAKYIKKPVEAEITYVGKNRREMSLVNSERISGEKELSSVTPVLINAGRRQGVVTGLMFLLPGEDKYTYQVLKITRVGANSSGGIVVRTVDKSGKEMYQGDVYDKALQEYNYEPFPPLKKGTRVTTSPVK
jgi:hypothetical protein